jgi:ABC-type bacteriocin/lantibiotic exporter with double-glycine peptidase domain
VTTGTSRRWLAPEVVQTSAMDCGPAALKCLLEGFGIPVSYGRLREACQTDVDGTSIDTIEVVANQLGISAEQEMVPVDHLFLSQAHMLPAVVVVRHGAGATHFVVVWRRHGRWLQVMDPSIGRRWMSCEKFAEEIFTHEQSVPAAQWREWAATDDFLKPLRQRLGQVGATENDAAALMNTALKDDGWFTFGALDASVRLVQSVINAGGIRPGAQAVKLLNTLFERTRTSTLDIYTLLPAEFWSATPDLTSVDAANQKLLLRGAVLLRAAGPKTAVVRAAEDKAQRPAPLSPELAAALKEKPRHPLLAIWDLLKQDGILAPLALIGAMTIAVGVLLIETLLFRGVLDIAWVLNQGSQRLAAVIALTTFVALLLLIEAPISMETMRFGRHLETRMRMALLAKLPHLTDRYFQSRPVSDMADRSHAIQMTRNVPAMGLRFLQTLCELVLTFIGVVLLDPGSATVAAVMALLPIALSMAAQPALNERDLRVRNHAGALNVFYLDAMLGLVPVRTHSAEKAVSRQHESLLVEWSRSSIGLVRINTLVSGLLAFVSMALAGYLLVDHFQRVGSVSGGDLLLVYWALKLPAVGGALASLAQQYPGQRNVLLRLLEPLSTPEELPATPDKPSHTLPAAPNPHAAGITLQGGSV